MKPNKKQLIGILVFTLLFPVLGSLVQYIPNPMVPGAIISLNMIIPILAGYFYGPFSGLVVGGTGTLLAALLQANQFYLAGVYSMALMGVLAGWVGRNYRSEVLSAATILVGHAANILILICMGMLVIPPERVGVTLLGLATESMIDIVAAVLLMVILKRWLYQNKRW